MAISASKIVGFGRKRASVTVPRRQIRHIKLSYDTCVKNPFLQFFMGFTLATLGLIGIITFLIAALESGHLIQKESGEFVLPMIPIILWLATGTGLWLLIRVFRAQYHLVVETDSGQCKIFFDRSTDIHDIRQLIRRANIDFGYEIESSVLEKMQISP